MPLDDSPTCRMHREKMAVNLIPDNLCVACPVGKAEIERTPAAKVAMQCSLMADMCVNMLAGMLMRPLCAADSTQYTHSHVTVASGTGHPWYT